MKKRLFLIFLIIFLLAGCGPLQPQQKEKTQIVATIFPLYDFAREIAGEDAEVKMLLKPGAEVHSYEPTPQDIIAIQNCDVFLYIGGESDEWVRNVLESIDTTDMQVVALMDCVDAVEEAENGFAWNGEHDHGDDEHAHEEMEYDEHIWTSPRKAIKMVKAITGALQVADHSHATGYAERAERYTGQLTALDEALTETVNNAERKLVIFADRFPFLYLVRNSSLETFWQECSSSSSAPVASAMVFAIKRLESSM